MADLIVSITSSNGKITAGVVNINLFSSGNFKMPLKKCSDKESLITF
jgi:hypothetical protein